MRKIKTRFGFTMMELMIVVAIIGVLAGVAFVGVSRYQRSMNQLELDAIAKEIFVAAQNHLTMAENEDYHGASIPKYSENPSESDVSEFGIPGVEEDDLDSNGKYQGIYYYVVNAGSINPSEGGYIFDMMLPFGAVDETVRMGGSYIVRYQPQSAIVLDVFYCDPNGKYRKTLADSDYAALLSLRDTQDSNKKSARLNHGGAVVGWYGGADAAQLANGTQIKEPVIEVKNEERLYVKVTDTNKNTDSSLNNDSASLMLIVTGETSGAQAAFKPSDHEGSRFVHTSVAADGSSIYSVILDDITKSGMHFADINNDVNIEKASAAVFIPGEDITILAVAYNNTELTNIAYSDKETTNSLFEKIERVSIDADKGINKDGVTAYVNNFRHLENLEPSVSSMPDNKALTCVPPSVTPDTTFPMNRAVQTNDMSWSGFIGYINDNNPYSAYGSTPSTVESQVSVYYYKDTAINQTANGCFLPVNLASVSYDGQGHNASGVKIDYAGEAGLFGTVAGVASNRTDYSVCNLTLIDFEVRLTTPGGASTYNAGVLAGSMQNALVDNVLAYNIPATENQFMLVSYSGNVGGLIGSMENCVVRNSAAAVRVESTGGHAGGLIGMTNGGSVSQSYSGGHTVKGTGRYLTPANPDTYNVATAFDTGMAGGLIGQADGETAVNVCYSTCSVSGKYAGGLIGGANQNVVKNCYAAGLVGQTAGGSSGAFIGTGVLKIDDGNAEKSSSDNYYVGGINSGVGSGLTLSAPLTPAKKNAVRAFGADQTLYKESVEYTGENEKVAFPCDKKGGEGTFRRDEASAYDTKLISDYEGDYGYLTIEQMTGYVKPGTSEDAPPVQLTRHYGDWQDPMFDANLEIINAERLTLKISMPEGYLADALELPILIKGEISEEEAYLVMKTTKSETDDSYLLTLHEKTDVAGMYTTGTGLTPAQKEDARNNWLVKASTSAASIADVKVIEETDTTDPANTKKYSVISFNLDSIVKDGAHFTQLFSTFIPGENLTVASDGCYATQTQLQAIIADETKWKKAASSDPAGTTSLVVAKKTNSLFADPSESETTGEGAAATTTLTMEGSDFSNPAQAVPAIDNIRHLENLDARISALDRNDTGNKLAIAKAVQIEDLIWSDTDAATDDFVSATKLSDTAKVKVYRLPAGTNAATASTDDCYLPVTPCYWTETNGAQAFTPYALVYDGKGNGKSEGGSLDLNTKVNHSITGIVVNTAENAGLFGTLGELGESKIDGSSVSNLALIDFDVTSTEANAGALAGKIRQATDLTENKTSVSNVIAYNTADYETTRKGTTNIIVPATVSSTGTATGKTGSAGGLIGLLEGGKAKVAKSAAALVVTSAGGNAGGLIGTANGGTLTGCYSGGHTLNGGYWQVTTSGTTTTKAPIYNVTATTGTAGGLIGAATGMGDVGYCYSTCSATGNVAGGFAGTFTGAGLSNCYATGLVEGKQTEAVSVTENSKTRTLTMPKDGAFAYSLTGTATNCKYFGIINERYENATNSTVTATAPTGENAKTSFFYLAALGQNEPKTGITELDATAAAYNGFVDAESLWTPARPYDNQLKVYYGEGTDTPGNPGTNTPATTRNAQYNLKSVARLGMTGIVSPSTTTPSTTPADFVATHYGDWPAPELFVVNSGS